MSVNRHKPHLVVLPEDDANREMVVGFQLQAGASPIKVLPPAGGWRAVVDEFNRTLSPYLRKFTSAHVVLMLDFDGDKDRRVRIEDEIPEPLRSRVFLLGVYTEPEHLRREVGRSLEQIGSALATECRDGTTDLWNHSDLQHNDDERTRLYEATRDWLLPDCP